MPISNLIFYLFATVAVLSGLGILLSKNVLYAAFLLILTFFCVAGIYVFAGAEFVAVTQVMIYAGGVLVLIVFGVMLTNKISGQQAQTENHNRFAGLLIGGCTFAGLCYLIAKTGFGAIAAMRHGQAHTHDGVIKKTGVLLMSDYLLPFEIVGILLLMALIGAAIVARGGKGAEE